MPLELILKRTVAFVDGQNLFHAARGRSDMFSQTMTPRRWLPRYAHRGLGLWRRLAFTPASLTLPTTYFWHFFWSAKMGVMGRQGVRVFSRSLHYRNRRVRLADGGEHTFLAGEENDRRVPAGAAIGIEYLSCLNDQIKSSRALAAVVAVRNLYFRAGCAKLERA